MRIYGKAPFKLATIHGGPGALGSMEPVARALSVRHGVIEPMQTKLSVQELIEELKTVLEDHAELPVTLIGHSWGAMLSYMFTGSYPSMVKKLILVSSGCFDEQYALGIQKTRFSRLSENQRQKLQTLDEAIHKDENTDKNNIFKQIGKLIFMADSYKPEVPGNIKLEYWYLAYQKIWPEVKRMRKEGELKKYGEKIQCPVIAIHGDYDPHPYQGIIHPLASVVKNFRYSILKNCGHMPWFEKEAKSKFFQILEKEIL